MYAIPELITRTCKKYANKIAIKNRKDFRTQETTYAQLYEKILSTSSFLEKLKIKKGDKILILGQSSLEYVVLFFGAIFQGIIVVPLDMQTDSAFINKVANRTKAKVLFTSRNIKVNIHTIKFDDIEYAGPKAASKLNPDEVVEILYTSGTTGNPKGVVLTNKNFMASVTAVRKLIWLPKLKFVSVLPLSHILEQVAGLLIPLSYGCSILYAGIIRPGRLTEIIRNKGINAIICVPSILSSLKQKNSVKNLGLQFFLIGVGGAKLDAELEKYWRRRFKLIIQG